jgi:hypothetical protein
VLAARASASVFVLVCFLCSLVRSSAASGHRARAASHWIWWEAEATKATNFPAVNPFAPTDEKAAQRLSGGKWVGSSAPGKVLFLEYEITAARNGVYDFYGRKFWTHGPFKWRFDNQPWQRSGADVPLLDDVSLGQFVNVNWVRIGTATLKAGEHSLRIEVDADVSAVAFDCFLLTDSPFVPRGRMKPGEKSGAAPEGWFSFEPDADPFGPAALDLRSLNERFAGEEGIIVARGNELVHARTGRQVRFWGVNSGHDLLNQDPQGMTQFARRLAKLGVNIVRLHGPLWRQDDLTRIDEVKLEKIHRLVAALKSEGIYLELSCYFPVWMQPKGVAGLEGFNGTQNPFAISFFNHAFQELQRGWWKDALTRKNPYTGLTLAQDPALAVIEIVNEDSLFFWTFSPYKNVPAPQMEILEREFGGWLAGRYGSLDKAFAAWGGAHVKGDLESRGRVGLMRLDRLARDRGVRAQDTAQFLAILQRQYFDGMRSFLREDLGFKGLVSGSNWITAEPRVLGPLDKWSNAGCDVMDRHGYYGGPHEGPRAGYLISNGDRYADASALLFETGRGNAIATDLPIMDLAYNGRPSIISEIGWVPPNRFRTEMPILAAAYGALQGTDGFFFFATKDVDWIGRLSKFSIADPAAMGQFPAAALIFRKGLVRTGDPAIRIESRLSDLFALDGIPVSAPQNVDEIRRADVPVGRPVDITEMQSMDPLAFLVGRVEVNVSESGGRSKVIDLSRFIDRKKKTVNSATGELGWDYGSGLVTVNAPAAEGAVGFLAKAGPIKLDDLKISSPLDYGSVVLVSLDERPLKTSRKMLLQVMTEDSNYGWSAPGVGLRPIVDMGGPPIVVKRVEGTIALGRKDASSLRVVPLDFNGYRSQENAPFLAGPSFSLLPTTLHYLIEEEGSSKDR